jgi:hypothetical protein
VVAFEGVTGPRVGRGGTFRVAERGARPLLVIEVTSPSTRKNDLTVKVQHYYRAGVPFYAIVDADEESERRPITVLGYRWTPEGYVFVPPDEQGRVWLEPVGLWLAGEQGHAVCYDAQGARILDIAERDRLGQQAMARSEELGTLMEEAVRAHHEADARAAAEAQARQAAEAQLADFAARLQAMEEELRRLRGQA